VPLLVSLTEARAIYLALELDRRWTENAQTKSADGRVATEAAWLNGNNSGKEKRREKEEKT
jgi:hypothetical protein